MNLWCRTSSHLPGSILNPKQKGQPQWQRPLRLNSLALLLDNSKDPECGFASHGIAKNNGRYLILQAKNDFENGLPLGYFSPQLVSVL